MAGEQTERIELAVRCSHFTARVHSQSVGGRWFAFFCGGVQMALPCQLRNGGPRHFVPRCADVAAGFRSDLGRPWPASGSARPTDACPSVRRRGGARLRSRLEQLPSARRHNRARAGDVADRSRRRASARARLVTNVVMAAAGAQTARGVARTRPRRAGIRGGDALRSRTTVGVVGRGDGRAICSKTARHRATGVQMLTRPNFDVCTAQLGRPRPRDGRVARANSPRSSSGFLVAAHDLALSASA